MSRAVQPSARKAVVTGGVAYHHALTRAGQPLADFIDLDIHALAHSDLEAFDLVVVLRSVDNEALWARRHQFARFLHRGGVLVSFGEAWTDWFPGCRWQAEGDADLLPPVVAEHSLLRGISSEAVDWHGKGPRWCNHGHFSAPAAAEVLVAAADGGAFAYIDRDTTNGVILAASNLDLDTHAFNGNSTARQLFGRLLAWAEAEATHAPERRVRAAPRLAGLYSGVHFQRGFYADAEFGPAFAVVPAEELAALDLGTYAGLWIPRESNQSALVRSRPKLAEYLAGGGTLVCFDEANQPWLAGLGWHPRHVDVTALQIARHPLVADLQPSDVTWHAHGCLTPPPGASVLISAGDAVVLYVDEVSHGAGRVLAGTLDPDCHVGYGSDRPRPLLRRLIGGILERASASADLAAV